MPTRRSVVAGASTALFGLSVAGSPAAAAKAPEQGLYLPHIQKLRTYDPKEFGDLAQDSAMIGDETTALAPDPDAKPQPQPPFDLSDARVVDALELIAEKARGRRIVILNEAHNVSRCRAFGEAVALRLRSEGFDTFAAETFFQDPGPNPFTAFQAGGPCVRWVGYYSSDPVFAEMLRSAREAGYRFFAYEQKSTQQGPKGADGRKGIRYREHAEAANLTAFLADNRSARVLVYCGYSHAAKGRVGHDAWMASRLIRMAGFDPLSIDQASGWPPLVPDPASRVDQTLARFGVAKPVALMRADGTPIMLHDPYAGDFDIQVVHPRLPPVDGRPGWLARAPGRRRAVYPLPDGLPAGALAQAAPALEAAAAADTVPADQYLLAAGAREAVFFLRPGRYVARVETASGRRALGLFSV